jgi:diguanylate cyclase (GGDEF)-like protein
MLARVNHLLYGDDRWQQIRLNRLLLAAATSCLTVGLVAMIAWAGYLPWVVVLRYGLLVLAAIVGFYGVIRVGLNRRLSDPSLTIPQLVVSGLVITYALRWGTATQPAFLALYLLAFMFGGLRLNTRQMLGVALFYAGCYAAILWLSDEFRPDSPERARAWFRLVFFVIVLAWLSVLGGYINGLRTRLRLANQALTDALHKAESLARRDGLTGCHNRMSLAELLQIETKRAARGSTFSVCVMDVDHFKSINDNFGHHAGDAVLKGVARTMIESLRATDIIVRFGGEEFLVLFPQTDAKSAALVAERLRVALEQERFDALPQGQHVTVSMGIAEHEPGDTAEQTISRADAALYEAKNLGRNRVLCAPEAGPRTSAVLTPTAAS